MFYSEVFSYDIDPNYIKKRDNLQKAGLKFDKSLILIENDETLESVSMVVWVRKKIPSTSKALDQK